MKTTLLLIIVTLSQSALQIAAQIDDYPKPPLAAYGALPQIADAELSPDGTKVATIVHLKDGSRLAVLSLEGAPPIQLGLRELKARGVEFYDNDHVILHVSETTKTYGFRGEYEYSGAFVFDLETQDVKQLLKGTQGVFPAQIGLGTIIGRSDKAGEVLMPALMGAAHSNPNLDLLRVPLNRPRGRRFARGTADTRDWFVGDGGIVLARERYNNRSNKYQVQSYKNKKWTTILEIEDEILPMSIRGVMPDETGLVFAQVQDDGFDALMKLSLDGEISGPLIPTKDREIISTYTDNNRKVLGIRYAGVEPDYAFLDPLLKDSYEKISAQLPGTTIYLDSWTDDRSKVLYRVFQPSLGQLWVSHSREDDTLKTVVKSRPDIPATAHGMLMNINYQARDGLTIQAILTAPPDYRPGETKPLPTLVLPHGGPASYDSFRFDWMAQYFANRGYLVFQPNFRGSTGFGREFEDAGRGEWGGKMQDDITDGLNALVAAQYTDPERVCIAGSSYGGYAALAGAVFTPELYKCVIAIAPVSDLNQMLKQEKRDYGRHHWVVSYWESVMAAGDARREKLRSISPANFAENVKAPVLLMHGDDDTVVPYAQSTKMRNALKRAGKDVELVRLKGEDHWLSVADTRLQTLEEMDRFLSEHLPVE
ncbi:MAG: alpha/beta hydrolase family protein [Henriciella sp.]